MGLQSNLQGKPEIGRVEFIVLMAFIMLLTALAIDIMLPAFDQLREYFNLGQESTATAQIVTFFFIGQIGQLAFGPLSDRYGRLAVLRVGFALYIVGSIAAAFAPSLSLMFAARFVVGLGAAALSVGAITSVRDRFSGDQMARTMALILTIFLFVPVIAPILGSAILAATSWQVVFLTPAIIAVLVFFWTLRLRESLLPERRLPLDVPTLIRSGRQVLGNRTFVGYTAITTVIFAVLTSYVGSSERMINEIYGRPDLFLWIFSAIGLTMAAFTFLNAQLISRIGAKRAIRALLLAYLISAGVLLLLSLNGTPNIYLFFALIALLQGLYITIEPSSSALALEPMGSTAGMASAIYGTSFFVVGSVLGSFIDRALVNSVTPLAVGYFVAALLANGLVYWVRARAVPAPSNLPAGDMSICQVGD